MTYNQNYLLTFIDHDNLFPIMLVEIHNNNLLKLKIKIPRELGFWPTSDPVKAQLGCQHTPLNLNLIKRMPQKYYWGQYILPLVRPVKSVYRFPWSYVVGYFYKSHRCKK